MTIQTQTDIGTISSLLPYLAGDGGHSPLRLSLTARDASSADKSYPFRILNDSNPAARLLEAAFVTDTGSEIRKAFLLLQKDLYSIQGNELRPLANPDIDNLWQRAFSFHAREGNDASSTVVLSAQLNGNGCLNQLAPLFFCRNKQLFFHPPCPACGRPLQLCRDDELLESSGLQPYSGSLKRYLYCTPCGGRGMEGFYVRERNHDDPPALKDRWSLIDEFGALRQSRDPFAPFPCIRCPEHDACHGPGKAAQSCIVPFSFYPFYLLIFDALSINALEFLPLVSGATFDELESRLAARNESGRKYCLQGIRGAELAAASFFTPADEKYFPEVLYLKLSFLGGVLRQFLAQPDILGHPEMRPTIERVWVDLPGRDSLLPLFWNFESKAIDLVTFPDTTEQAAIRPSSNLLFYLGLLWFHALLVNKKQGDKAIFPALEGKLPGKEGSSPGERSDHVFAPENIFWDPDDGNVNSKWHPFWEKSLDLGLILLRSATARDPHWSYGDFFRNLEKLRAEVKSALFMEAPGDREEPVRDGRHAGDDEACRILTAIMARWREKLKTETAAGAGTEDFELMETVILPSSKVAPPPPSASPEEFTETVILSTTPSQADPSADPRQSGTDDPLPETVILSSDSKPDDPGGKAMENDPENLQEAAGENDLEATVILPPQRTGETGKGRRGGYE